MAMVVKLEIIEIGAELGVILPPEILDALEVKEGDTLLATVEENSILLKKDQDGRAV